MNNRTPRKSTATVTAADIDKRIEAKRAALAEARAAYAAAAAVHDAAKQAESAALASVIKAKPGCVTYLTPEVRAARDTATAAHAARFKACRLVSRRECALAALRDQRAAVRAAADWAAIHAAAARAADLEGLNGEAARAAAAAAEAAPKPEAAPVITEAARRRASERLTTASVAWLGGWGTPGRFGLAEALHAAAAAYCNAWGLPVETTLEQAEAHNRLNHYLA